MKRKITVLILTLALCAVCAVLALLAFRAKTAPPASVTVTDAGGGQETDAAEEAVKPLLEDWDEIVLAPKPDVEGVVAQYYSEVSVEIVSLDDAGDGTGVATVNVTAPDMRAVFERLLDELEAAEQIPDERLRMTAENAVSSILQGEHEKTTATIEAQVTDTADGWRIVPDDAWSEAVSGGMTELYREYYLRLFEESEMFTEGIDPEDIDDIQE
ncbi:MAG: hypothetical protein LBK23_02440 [Oscillospiraceae bacterium]|jgi:hypothetical protein|nr:hypothetical protein [Oscillospiraceae bacterium]